jgi:uncharacterized membrane protein YgcG
MLLANGGCSTVNTFYRPVRTEATKARIFVDCTVGVAISVIFAVIVCGTAHGLSPVELLAVLLVTVFGYCWLVHSARKYCRSRLVRCARRLTVTLCKLSAVSRLALGVIAMIAMVVVAWRFESVLAPALAFTLPSAVVLGCGTCAVALGLLRPERWMGDVPLVATVAIGLAALIRPRLITADPAVGLLIPTAVWLAVQGWHLMSDSKYRVVRASADVATALLLGTILDLIVVWGANLAGLPALKVARTRHLLSAVAAGNSPSWWYSAIPLLLIAGAYLALARWNDRLAATGARAGRSRVIRWLQDLPGIGQFRLRSGVAAFNFSRRMMTFLHVGLLLASLVGLTAPGLLMRTLHGELQAPYAIAYHADLEARTEILAYRQLTREVAAASPGQRAEMRADVEEIASGPVDAWDLGQEQGAYLARSGQAPAGEDPESAPQQAASMTVATEAAEVQAEEEDSIEDADHADQAGSTAAAAIGTILSIPNGNPATQVLQEYLGGLIEESPVADALARLVGRAAGGGMDDLSAEQAISPEEAEEEAASDGSASSSGSGGQTSGEDSSGTGTDDDSGMSGGDSSGGAGGDDG